jgi:hypothetical protein
VNPVANLPLGFAEVIAGGVLIVAGFTGTALGDVVKGQVTTTPLAGASSGSTPVATSGGSGSASSAGASSGIPSAGQVTAAGGSGTAVGQVTYSDLNAIAKQHGWDASEVAAWVGVIIKESGGILTAQNSTSDAYGIAQFINGPSEYAQYGGNSTTVIGQLTSMANYIEERYGTPSAALAHENSNDWY